MGKIEFVEGNIFATKATEIVCPVNCRGAMGKGLAKQFSERFPGLEDVYKELCDVGAIKLGAPYRVETSSVGIWLFPTKDDWRERSKLGWVAFGLGWMSRFPTTASIAFPALGCGLGGLPWYAVKELFWLYACSSPDHVHAEVYLPR